MELLSYVKFAIFWGPQGARLPCNCGRGGYYTTDCKLQVSPSSCSKGPFFRFQN